VFVRCRYLSLKVCLLFSDEVESCIGRHCCDGEIDLSTPILFPYFSEDESDALEVEEEEMPGEDIFFLGIAFVMLYLVASFGVMM
jgi:hypothetical protein